MTSEVITGTTLPRREVSRKRLEDYREIAGGDVIDDIRTLALPLQGTRVLHINSSPAGGGVADILVALVPLLNDIGLSAEWRTIRGDGSFFEITKKMHNSLQGKPVDWTRTMWDTWLKFNQQNARELDPDYDIIVVHDPQPAALHRYTNTRNGNGRAKWLWRCHIDLTDTPPELWRKLLPYIQVYDGAEFSTGEFVGKNLTDPEIFVTPPAIDPLDARNVPLGRKAAAKILAEFGIDPERPIMAQISRFDPWKDPLGVIDTYRLVKRKVEDIQLVMIGPTASDDPEGWTYFEKTARRAGEDSDIHLLTSVTGADDLAINAVQTRADVIVQKSIREGFGLSVAGSLWHGKPVVAGRAGGIVIQVIDGETGFLIDSTEQCGNRALALLEDPAFSRKLGKRAKEHVRRNFLITRYLRDSLASYSQLLNGSLN